MKDKIIYRRGTAYNANTGKKMYCIEARINGKWMPAFFESGFFITESAAAASKEVFRRNRLGLSDKTAPAGIPTETEMKKILEENKRMKARLGQSDQPSVEHGKQNIQEQAPASREINLFEDNSPSVKE